MNEVIEMNAPAEKVDNVKPLEKVGRHALFYIEERWEIRDLVDCSGQITTEEAEQLEKLFVALGDIRIAVHTKAFSLRLESVGHRRRHDFDAWTEIRRDVIDITIDRPGDDVDGLLERLSYEPTFDVTGTGQNSLIRALSKHREGGDRGQ